MLLIVEMRTGRRQSLWKMWSIHGACQISMKAIYIELEGIPRSEMTVARFDPTGRYIFVGTSSGSILVFSTKTKRVGDKWDTRLFFGTHLFYDQMIARYKTSGAGLMKGIEFSQNGRYAT